MKTYSFAGLAGCVIQRRSRKTGHLVGVYNGDQAGMCTDDGRSPWSTVCEQHGSVCSHANLTAAKDWSGDPVMWCEPCQKELQS